MEATYYQLLDGENWGKLAMAKDKQYFLFDEETASFVEDGTLLDYMLHMLDLSPKTEQDYKELTEAEARELIARMG